MNIWYVIGGVALAFAVAALLSFGRYGVPEPPQHPILYAIEAEPQIPGVKVSLKPGTEVTVSIQNNLEESIIAIFYEETILSTGKSSYAIIYGDTELKIFAGQTKEMKITPGKTFFNSFYLPFDIITSNAKYECKAKFGWLQP